MKIDRQQDQTGQGTLFLPIRTVVWENKAWTVIVAGPELYKIWKKAQLVRA